MFSGGEKGRGPHAAVTRVEGIVERMVRAHERMVGVTGPHLQRLSECYQYHYLKQRSTKVQEVFCYYIIFIVKLFLW